MVGWFVGWLVGWLVGDEIFSETALRIFLIFCMKLGAIKVEKLPNQIFEKNSWFYDICERSPKSDTSMFFRETALRIFLVFGLKLVLNMTFNLNGTYFLETFAIWKYLTSKSFKKSVRIAVFGNFLDFASLGFLDFAHNGRWAWCLVVFLQFASPVNVFVLYSESEENILCIHCQKYFSPHLNSHHLWEIEHSAQQNYVTCSYVVLSLGCTPNVINGPLLYCWHWVKRFLRDTLFHNFRNILQTLDRDQRKLLFTRFNLENILPSLALETGTMNNNLVINSTSLQRLLLGAVNILCHWLNTKLWWEKESSLHILQTRTSFPKDWKWVNFIPASFNGIIS